MTTRTRRRLVLCAVIAAITLPAEFVLLKAVQTDARTASAAWVDRLPETSLAAAARDIQRYPFQYRKEIMGRLSPEARARVWIDHIAAYRDARPELSTEQVDALTAAMAVAEAAMLSSGEEQAAARAETRVIAERVVDLFGVEVADYLLYRLGNKTTMMLVNAVPWHVKLSDYVRERFVVQARFGDCNCNDDFGCDLLSLTWCDGAVSCQIDDDWPACGWFWNEVCDGVCKIGGIST